MSASDDQPSFEQSLTELQRIVTELEEGSLGLEESMQRFERGMALLRGCYQALQQAEQRIEILTGFDAEGNPVLSDFDATATHDPARKTAGRRARRAGSDEPAPDPADPDDGRTLF